MTTVVRVWCILSHNFYSVNSNPHSDRWSTLINNISYLYGHIVL